MVQTKVTAQVASEALEELIATLISFRSMTRLVDEIAAVLTRALKNGRKILTCGNGGSAADALHMAEELVGRYKSDRRPLPAISLVADSTLITCIGNDFGFENIFSRQIEALAHKDDVVVAFSSSGNSPNLIRALDAAQAKGAVVIALLGKGGGAIAGRADYEIIVPSSETARIQEIHTLALHIWLERIDSEFQ
jgi:D-sedoheptulose 7-phosphate isomerase